jgi:predicted nucleic acid-binding protein
MKLAYVIDTNVIFSAALNLNSGIGRFILKVREYKIQLYAPKYLKVEIDKHLQKIVEKSQLSPEEVGISLSQIYSNITFIEDKIIPFEEHVKALRLVRNIDPDDVTFVALANYMDEKLWTGDSKLYQGLRSLGYENVVNFEDLRKAHDIPT